MPSAGRKSSRIRGAGRVCLTVLAASTLCQATSQVEPTSANPQFNRGLKILYVGRPGSDREKDFVGFLKQYFDVVRTGNLETFQEADTQGYDVTLLDWDWNVIRGPYPKVSRGFCRPVITLGVRGGLICRNWRLKTGHH
jgi:hypothetical protein